MRGREKPGLAWARARTGCSQRYSSSYSEPVTTISIELELLLPRWKAPGTLALTWASVWARNLPFSSWAISSAERVRADQSRRIITALPELKLPPPNPGAEIR